MNETNNQTQFLMCIILVILKELRNDRKYYKRR